MEGPDRPDLVKQYFMGATLKTDWQVGHPITFSGTWEDKPFEDKGEIITFEPEQEMSYSHWSPLSGADDVPDNYHVVHITLEDGAVGTKVTLGHVARLEEGRRRLTSSRSRCSHFALAGCDQVAGRMRNFWPVA